MQINVLVNILKSKNKFFLYNAYVLNVNYAQNSGPITESKIKPKIDNNNANIFFGKQLEIKKLIFFISGLPIL